MVKRYDVNGVRSPGGRFSHVGEIGPNARLFHLAGQTGTGPDGTIGEGIEEQAALVYRNIATVLNECHCHSRHYANGLAPVHPLHGSVLRGDRFHFDQQFWTRQAADDEQRACRHHLTQRLLVHGAP